MRNERKTKVKELGMFSGGRGAIPLVLGIPGNLGVKVCRIRKQLKSRYHWDSLPLFKILC